MQKGRLSSTRGFTIVELAVVLFIITLIAILSFVGYGNVQGRARDKAVQADTLSMEALVVRYGVNNDGVYGAGSQWYSNSGPSGTYDFTPSEGNRIDVVANTDEFCIRAYSPFSPTYRTLATAYSIGALPTSCASLGASGAALADS